MFRTIKYIDCIYEKIVQKNATSSKVTEHLQSNKEYCLFFMRFLSLILGLCDHSIKRYSDFVLLCIKFGKYLMFQIYN